MPNGGLNIEKFGLKMLESTDKYSVFVNLNFALVDLLKNGIVPMIRQRFNHYDIKAGNILYSSDGYARLIDWGLAGSNDGKTIPEAIKNRSIAFNMPFSDIFFNSYIKQWLPEEMRKIKASLNFRDKNDGQRELLKVVAVNMINKSIEETSEGHFEYITGNILHDIYKIYASKGKYDLLDYNVLSFNVLIEYIQAVLIKYVDENGNFNDIGYFYDVFVHNVDIWGFVMTYAPIVEDGADKMHKDVINGICRILLKYCFSPEFAIKQINVNELALDLLSLNDIARSVTPNKIPTHKIPVHKIPVNKLPLNKLSVNKIPNITFNHSMLTPASATPKE
jgi:serine/threonine protein kinase